MSVDPTIIESYKVIQSNNQPELDNGLNMILTAFNQQKEQYIKIISSLNEKITFLESANSQLKQENLAYKNKLRALQKNIKYISQTICDFKYEDEEYIKPKNFSKQRKKSYNTSNTTRSNIDDIIYNGGKEKKRKNSQDHLKRSSMNLNYNKKSLLPTTKKHIMTTTDLMNNLINDKKNSFIRNNMKSYYYNEDNKENEKTNSNDNNKSNSIKNKFNNTYNRKEKTKEVKKIKNNYYLQRILSHKDINNINNIRNIPNESKNESYANNDIETNNSEYINETKSEEEIENEESDINFDVNECFFKKKKFKKRIKNNQ